MEFIPAKTIVNKTKTSCWFGINYIMNIYKGCCHGCIYCDSRSRCYQIDNFDTVRAKLDSTDMIDRELKSKIKKGVIGTGAMSDPYNPFEKKYKLTREALKLIDKYRFGVAIDTKSSLITRDIDILKDIKDHSPTIAKITITTWDDKISKIVEPYVSSSSERFESIRKLSEAGIYTGILMGPMLPFIEDTKDNVMGIVNLAYENGANFISTHPGLTLRDNQREWYYNKLDETFPNLKHKYIKTYEDRYDCLSPKYKELMYIFKEECAKKNILYKMEDIIDAYKKSYETTQISLFD
ncbi:SPL family radical SAM protein [Metaclostridioides mangenotii]|uniref:DNA repair photolyase n=1 Tax=Metaclostridioides mangenotii TaxID=1540 RepID=A0ABS4E825_9FIRM|nr:radical SAM protein [Clostridioides mangenotii]MBP1854095.1 DNA repair photolyase [Clostridioides mangenotii]